MPRKHEPRTAVQKDLRPGPHKRRKPSAKSRVDMNTALEVSVYSVREYPGQLGIPPANGNYAGTDLAYMILEGQATTVPSSIQVNAFFIHFVPDGLQLPKAGYSPNEKAIEMVMNWSQFHALLGILQTADSVQALYSSSGGVTWADVEGQFTRK